MDTSRVLLVGRASLEACCRGGHEVQSAFGLWVFLLLIHTHI